jgi:hypothetical protein
VNTALREVVRRDAAAAFIRLAQNGVFARAINEPESEA